MPAAVVLPGPRYAWVFLFPLLLAVSEAASAAPPEVVRTEPANGATEVDPGLRAIVVEFDQPMNTRGRSIVGGGPKFPKFNGDIRWKNAKTIVIPVALEPDHEYWLSFNNAQFRNFTSRRGESAVPYPLRFRTAGAGSDAPGEAPALTPERNEAAVAVLRNAIDQHYSYRDRLGLNWDTLFKEHGPALRNAASPEAFAEIAGVMLAPAEDKHVWLRAGDTRVGSFVRPIPGNFSTTHLKQVVPRWRMINGAIYTGRFDDGVGYAFINSLNGAHPEWYDALYIWLWENADAPGLIIDLRANGGGDEGLAMDFVGCLIDDPKLYAKHVFRDPGRPDGFSPVSERWVAPNKTRPRYRGPVAVLSGPVVMSSAEAFLLMMKQVPDAVVIGEASQGSSGNPRPHDLGNGVTVYLPSWKSMTPDGVFFEGVGIAPDLEVSAPPEAFRDRDPVLDTALDWIRKQ